MTFKQYYLQNLSHASYLVGDEDSHIPIDLLKHHHYSNIVDLVSDFAAWKEAVMNPSLQSAAALQEPGGRTVWRET